MVVCFIYLFSPHQHSALCNELCHLKTIRLIDCVCALVNGIVGLVPPFMDSVFNLAERFTWPAIFHPAAWLEVTGGGEGVEVGVGGR